MFYETPKISLKGIFSNFLFPKRKVLNFVVKEGHFVIPVSSGKAAIHLVLDWLRHKGTLSSRIDEVLVPQWMGAWVYKSMHSHAFPNTVLTPRTKVVWVYHQYGFPQDMKAIIETARNRNLTIVEDCAHALDSIHKGARLGTLGDFGIFSFSKFLPSLMGGAIVTKDKDARDYFLTRIRARRSFFALFCFWTKYFQETFRGSSLMEELLKTSYELYGSHVSMTKTVQNLIADSLNTLERRKENYGIVKRALKGDPWIDSLESDVLPYVIPISAPADALSRIVEIIRGANVYSEIYHFDERRNLLEPKFVKVAWLPVHQAIPGKVMERVSAEIKSVLHG